MSLAPEIAAFIEAGNKAGLPELWEAPVEVHRANTQSRPANGGTPEPIHEVKNQYIPGPTADLPIRIYRPNDKTDNPAIIFFHGGGWVLNFIDIYDAMLHRLANQSQATVISVNYQKAPEHPYPTPFNDCFATLLWVKENAVKLGVNPLKVGLFGDSAGGNLASAVALKARDNNISLAFQVLIYPCNERNFDTASYRDMAEGFGLTTRSMQWFWQQYLQSDSHNNDPYAAPSTSKSFKDVAPAIVVTAQYDPLLSDSTRYVELLKGDGVEVSYKEFAGMNHGFIANLAITPTATVAIDYCAEKIRETLGAN
jgi:acetyl esterase